MELQKCDYNILREIGRWRFLLSRHIKHFGEFNSQRTADRHVRALVDASYLKKEKILYGVPSLYTLTHKARVLCGYSKKPDKIRIEQIPHDILVLDTAILLKSKFNFKYLDVISEKELHSKDGFANRKHCPDFVFKIKKKSVAVEIELSLKSKDRLYKNIQLNYLEYDFQFWFIDFNNKKLVKNLRQIQTKYPNLELIDIDTCLLSK